MEFVYIPSVDWSWWNNSIYLTERIRWQFFANYSVYCRPLSILPGRIWNRDYFSILRYRHSNTHEYWWALHDPVQRPSTWRVGNHARILKSHLIDRMFPNRTGDWENKLNRGIVQIIIDYENHFTNNPIKNLLNENQRSETNTINSIKEFADIIANCWWN